jgi:hypothetical protein
MGDHKFRAISFLNETKREKFSDIALHFGA